LEYKKDKKKKELQEANAKRLEEQREKKRLNEEAKERNKLAAAKQIDALRCQAVSAKARDKEIALDEQLRIESLELKERELRLAKEVAAAKRLELQLQKEESQAKERELKLQKDSIALKEREIKLRKETSEVDLTCISSPEHPPGVKRHLSKKKSSIVLDKLGHRYRDDLLLFVLRLMIISKNIIC
jgi:nucleolar protein involved in exit from mitosis